MMPVITALGIHYSGKVIAIYDWTKLTQEEKASIIKLIDVASSQEEFIGLSLPTDSLNLTWTNYRTTMQKAIARHSEKLASDLDITERANLMCGIKDFYGD